MRLELMKPAAIAVLALAGSSAFGGEPFFVAPDGSSFPWERGITADSAYAEWDQFTSPFGGNVPDVGVFAGTALDPNAADWDVSDASGGAFITAFGNIYAIFDALDITVLAPSFGLGPGFETMVVLQLRTQGTELDLTTVTLDGVAPDSTEQGNIIDLGPPMVGGGGRQVDHRFVWTVDGNASGYEFRFQAVEGSLSLDRVIVDQFAAQAGPAGCNEADLAAPFDRLDIADVVAFLGAFGAQEPEADVAEPFDRWDIADVVAFLGIFGQGCP